MDLRDKVVTALQQSLTTDFIRLDDDDGISGFVVAGEFKGMTPIDRQTRIDKAIRKASLTKPEQRRILMIAGLTPDEYDAVGARIRVHEVKELAAGSFEILLHGGMSDAEYVRRALQKQQGIHTTNPEPVPGVSGVLMTFHVKGSSSNPLTKKKVTEILKKDK